MENNIEDKKKFAEILKGLSYNFGGRIEKEDLALRFKILSEYSINEISKGAVLLIKTRTATFPAIPTTKEIIDAIEKTSGKLDMHAIAVLEADKVEKNLKYFGRECKTEFKNKTTQYLMTQRYNFFKLGMMDAESLKWWRKEFIEAHQEIAGQEPAFLGNAAKAGLIPVKKLKNLLPGSGGD